MNPDIKKLKEIIDNSRNIVFFGGAGVSTESGIPDFRSANGLYNQDLGREVSPEEMISHSFYVRHTKDFYEFYKDKLIYKDAKPNACHKALAELEKQGKVKAVVTQNIDGLHQAAGSQRVYELHGSIHRNTCLSCGRRYGPEYIRDSKEPVPLCSCGGRIKPDVVLYEEGLDNDVLSGAIHAIRQADLMIVAGTSLTVYPAAGLISYFRGNRLVLINRDATPMDSQCDLVIHDSVGKVLGSLT